MAENIEGSGTGSTSKKKTTKTIVLVGHGGVDKLKIQERPMPEPEKEEVLVRVKAAGMNFTELMARAGLYDACPRPPCVLGYEAAGEVAARGEEVTDFQVGERVLVLSSECWSEYISVPATALYRIPDSMSFSEAAALPVSYVTAYLMLHDYGNLKKNRSVLIHSAAGGVGMAATQLCKCVENVTVFGTASASKHDVIKEAGVTHPIDYRTQDYVKEVRKISPQGVDIVLDPLALEDSFKGFNLLKPMGKIIHYGMANVIPGTTKNPLVNMKKWWGSKAVNPLDLMAQNRVMCGLHLGYLFQNKDMHNVLNETLLEIISLYEQGKIKPHIDSVWAFEDIDLAQTKMHNRQNIGKMVLSTEKAPEERETSKKSKDSAKAKASKSEETAKSDRSAKKEDTSKKAKADEIKEATTKADIETKELTEDKGDKEESINLDDTSEKEEKTCSNEEELPESDKVDSNKSDE